MTQVIEKSKKAAPLSRLGRKPVDIPVGVKVNVVGQVVTVQGKRGNLSWTMPGTINAKVEGNQINVFPHQAGEEFKSMHGLVRKLILNMVEGVTNGFVKKLVVEGVGFRSVLAGDKLTMTLGYSHPAVYTVPKDIKITIDGKAQNILIIDGNDKQRVGEAAASIRAIKLPEPYKGTGIRYENEVIKRKVGKAAVASAGAGAGGGKK